MNSESKPSPEERNPVLKAIETAHALIAAGTVIDGDGPTEYNRMVGACLVHDELHKISKVYESTIIKRDEAHQKRIAELEAQVPKTVRPAFVPSKACGLTDPSGTGGLVPGHYVCPECGQWVLPSNASCHCGARLDWSGR